MKHVCDCEDICPYKIQDILQKEFARVSKEHPVMFCRNGEIIERSADGTEKLIKKLH